MGGLQATTHKAPSCCFSRGIPLNYGLAGKAGRVPVGISARRLKTMVTGGVGFVGRHLVDRLIASGNDVIVIDNFSFLLGETGKPMNMK